MLYHRLLSALTSRSTPFDFDALWDYLGLDPERRFGDGFLVQAGLWDGPADDVAEVQPSMSNLRDLGKAWHNLVEARSTLAGVDDKMELVYRLQSQAKGKGKGRASAPGTLEWALRSLTPDRNEEVLSREARDLAIAIRNSLLDGAATPQAHVDGGASKHPIDMGVDAGEVDAELQEALYQSLFAAPPPKLGDLPPKPPRQPMPHPMFAPTPTPPPQPATPPQIPPPDLEPQGALAEAAKPEQQEEYDTHGFKIIGRKQVVYDQAKLDAHLESVFQFWRSERKPVGVPVELARRCK